MSMLTLDWNKVSKEKEREKRKKEEKNQEWKTTFHVDFSGVVLCQVSKTNFPSPSQRLDQLDSNFSIWKQVDTVLTNGILNFLFISIENVFF